MFWNADSGIFALVEAGEELVDKFKKTKADQKPIDASVGCSPLLSANLNFPDSNRQTRFPQALTHSPQAAKPV